MTLKPDYFEKGIVNLMSSITGAFDSPSPYNPLQDELLSNLGDSKNVVLLIIDGLGYNYLKSIGKKTTLCKHVKSAMSTVFLPSTGSAVSSFFTGLPPQQHAITGWWVYLREFGLVSRILPFVNTIDSKLLGTNISNAITTENLFTEINREYYILQHEEIVDSTFSKHMSGSAKRSGFLDFPGLLRNIKETIESSSSKKYIYSYYGELDAVSHMLGVNSPESKEHLDELDIMLSDFAESLQGSNTTIIITGDHGFNDVPLENVIYTRDYPQFQEYLILPPCGDTRTAFCYVRPSRVDDFHRFYEEKLSEVSELYRSNDLVEDNWFGLFEPHPELHSRVGDYTLVFKEGNAIMNCFPGLEPPVLRGHHGGLSEDELFVPLVILEL